MSAVSRDAQKRLMNQERLYWYMELMEARALPAKKRVTA